MAFKACANFSTNAAAERRFKEPMLKIPSRHFPTIRSSTAGIARRSRKTFFCGYMCFFVFCVAVHE